MTDTQVIEQAERAASESATDRFLESLGERIGSHAKAEAVFGQPIVKNGLTVVPVARVRYAFGAGSGTAPDVAQTEEGAVARTGSGSGGGGGVTADPIGYLEIRSEGAAFKSIGQLPSPAFILACGIAAGIVIRALAAIARR